VTAGRRFDILTFSWRDVMAAQGRADLSFPALALAISLTAFLGFLLHLSGAAGGRDL